MATIYLRSAAAGAANGTTKTDAYTTLVAAFAGAAAGDNIFMASDHAETQTGAMTLTSPGTNTNPVNIYCVNFAGSTPPVHADLLTTGSVSCTTNTDITKAGFCNVDGVIFSVGSAGNGASIRWSGSAANGWKYRNCELKIAGTGGGNFVFGNGGANGNVHEMYNTGIRVGATSCQLLLNAATLYWRNTASAIRGATIPTSLFGTSSAAIGTSIIDGVDLSPMGSGKNIVNGNTAAAPAKLYFSDCKLDAAVTRYAAVSATYGTEAFFTRCGSSGNYDFSKHNPLGTLTAEITVVRTGGASDGTTPHGYKVVTTANAKWAYPFECPPLAVWNDVVASTITITVYGVWTGGALPNNDDIWMDIQYLGDASSPQASLATTTKASGLETAAAVDADSSTWGGGTTKFKLTKTITAPAQKGDILVFIKVGAASATAYFDPKVVIT